MPLRHDAENLVLMTHPPLDSPSSLRRQRGIVAQARGVVAEAQVAQVLMAEGWHVLGQRVRTSLGELDLITERCGVLVFIEVKQRATLTDAAYALSPRQIVRLCAAAEAWMAANPGHGDAGVRFDVLLRDDAGGMRRIVDAFRPGMG